MVRSQPHLLHVFSTFVPAGPETRTVALIEALGHEFRHSILAIDGRTDAHSLFSGRYDVKLLDSLPRAGSIATLKRLRTLIKDLQPAALCSYNWGAFDAIFAARSLGFRRVLHHEDGFNADEAREFKARRVWARRLVLPGVHRVVVPSQRLERIARDTWKLGANKIACVPNGIRVERFELKDGRARLRKELGIPINSPVIGYVGHLRPEKNPLRCLRAAMRIDPEIEAHVLILGDGPEREACEKLARETRSLYGRVHFAGFQRDPREYYRAMDLFCISSDTEQMPVALLEAMATGLPVVSTDVGDVRVMLPEAQGEFVIPLAEHESAWPLAEKLSVLCADAAQRQALGRANRARVTATYSFEAMLERYRELYRSVQKA